MEIERKNRIIKTGHFFAFKATVLKHAEDSSLFLSSLIPFLRGFFIFIFIFFFGGGGTFVGLSLDVSKEQ